LSAVLLHALASAAARHPVEEVSRMIRFCHLDHRAALKALLDAAGSPGPVVDELGPADSCTRLGRAQDVSTPEGKRQSGR
jgi:hypothetical protein